MRTNTNTMDKPLYKTFTYLLLLFALIIFLPTLSSAKTSFEVSVADVKYGDKDLIKFYPNPMTTDANVKISDEIDLEKNSISIEFYNIIGAKVYKINLVKEYELRITRDIFKNSGIYFYQLKIEDKVITTGRITVR